MSSKFNPTRRLLLQGGASVAAFGAMTAGAPLAGLGDAFAQAATPLPFQLSWIKSIQYGGYFAGIENGFYKKHGIDPTFNSGGPNVDPVANVASGQSALGDRPIGSLLVARDKGIPIKIIATVFQTSPYAVLSLKSKPINSVKELQGKTIAVATSGRPLVLNLLRDAGLDPKSVNLVPSSPDPSALVSGQIDAYAGYVTNQGVMLESKGIEIVALNVHELGIPETTGTIYAREDYLKANRDAVVRFLKASIESWRWALDNPDATAKLMVEKYGNPGLDLKAQTTEIKASKPFIESGAAATKGLLALDVPLFDKIIEVYRKADLVKGKMTAAELCDASFIEAAHKS